MDMATSVGSLVSNQSPGLNSVLDQSKQDTALKVLHRVRKQDPTTSARFTKRVTDKASIYSWPLQKKDASIEEQILSPMHANQPKILKTDLPLNTVIEATKQIRTAARQLNSPFSPKDKPITPFTVTSANASRQRVFGSPKSSIRVSSLMSNGLSYPDAMKIYRKSVGKHHGKTQINLSNLNQLGLQQDSIMSKDESLGSQGVHFSDSVDLAAIRDPVQLPTISKSGALASRHASVTKNQNMKEQRDSGMKYYTTFIRKVNEHNVNLHRARKAGFEKQQPDPTHYQKYKKYMSMIEEDDGSFPRVSELSMRVEQDRILRESRERLRATEKLQMENSLERERKKMMERDRLLNVQEQKDVHMFYKVKEDGPVFTGINPSATVRQGSQSLEWQTISSNDVGPPGTAPSQTMTNGVPSARSKFATEQPESGTNTREEKSHHDQEVEMIVVNVKAMPKNEYEVPEQRDLNRTSRLNKKYRRIITQESETVKHLYKMLSPKMANFKRARKEIEPYDDLDTLRETNIGQRLAELRKQIYKNQKDQLPAKGHSVGGARNTRKKKLAPQLSIMSATQGTFGNRNHSRASKMSEDISEIYPEGAPRGISPFSNYNKRVDSPAKGKIEMTPWEQH